MKTLLISSRNGCCVPFKPISQPTMARKQTSAVCARVKSKRKPRQTATVNGPAMVARLTYALGKIALHRSHHANLTYRRTKMKHNTICSGRLMNWLATMAKTPKKAAMKRITAEATRDSMLKANADRLAFSAISNG